MDALVGLIAVLLQLQSAPPDWLVPQCAAAHCRGRRIDDNMGVLGFCLPEALKAQRQTGEHGDVHYEVKIRRKGVEFELRIISGPYYPGHDPDWGSGWAIRDWRSPESAGKDFRLSENGLHSRYISLNTPMGHAYYKRVPAAIASQFDAVLDSLCWRKFSLPKR